VCAQAHRARMNAWVQARVVAWVWQQTTQHALWAGVEAWVGGQEGGHTHWIDNGGRDKTHEDKVTHSGHRIFCAQAFRQYRPTCTCVCVYRRVNMYACVSVYKRAGVCAAPRPRISARTVLPGGTASADRTAARPSSPPGTAQSSDKRRAAWDTLCPPWSNEHEQLQAQARTDTDSDIHTQMRPCKNTARTHIGTDVS
jgi:hypothetical protein